MLDVKRCDFVVWTPKDFVVIRMEKDQEFINAMIHFEKTLYFLS